MTKRYPRAVNREESTDFSFADTYIEERRTGQWRRIQVGFPLSDDRAAGNIDYQSQDWHRSYRGKAPNPGPDYNKLEVRAPLDLDTSKYKFINSAKNGSNVEQGYYGTSSGISLIVEEPFSSFYGDPTDNPVMVGAGFDNTVTSGETFIAKSLDYSNPLGETPYYPVDSGSNGVGRFNWQIDPSYQAPTEPAVRFPMGARRRVFFRN